MIIVTRGHRDDMRVLKLALATPARYIAMIGSKRKVINVIRELEKEGVARAAFERIHAPMGLDIGAISPEEIAISVAAEMIAVRRGAASNWRALSHVGFRRRIAAGRAGQVSAAGLILAAGESRRMGSPKALLHTAERRSSIRLIGRFSAALLAGDRGAGGARRARSAPRARRPAMFVREPGLRRAA